MSLLPLVKTIIKLAICFGPLFIGIRCLFVTDPKTDSFAFDVKQLHHFHGMSRRKFWRKAGITCIVTGAFLILFLLVL